MKRLVHLVAIAVGLAVPAPAMAADPCSTSGAVTAECAAALANNLHDDLFVIVGAVVGAALVPSILIVLSGRRG